MRSLVWLFCLALLLVPHPAASDTSGLFVRFKMTDPRNSHYYIHLGGTIHVSPWWLGETDWPADAAANPASRIPAGEFTPWLDLRQLETPDGKLHGRLQRSGGVAEFPNITLDVIADPDAPSRKIVIELATAPDDLHVVRTLSESYTGSRTSFTVSPDLDRDCDELETASQMSARHVRWAREVVPGRITSPQLLSLMTGFWRSQRPELDLKEANVLKRLGFNATSGQPEVVLNQNLFDVFSLVGNTFRAEVTRDDSRVEFRQYLPILQSYGTRLRQISFNDEVRCDRFQTQSGEIPQRAIDNFHAWLAARQITPDFLGVSSLSDIRPLGLPGTAAKPGDLVDPYARRTFYLSCRFRQESTTERMRWASEIAHDELGSRVITHTMPADHPFFGFAGMGFAMTDDGGYLSCDWFDLARRQAMDSLGIEDWLGLQYMYGPGYTWEGFQLLSFMADIFRSGARSAGRDDMPMMAWITPSDARNVRLKTASCLAHGVKSFYMWIYGPTSVSTENYWSDLKSEYEGVAYLARLLAAGEDLLVPGRQRPTRLALFYSISSDIWQPLGYAALLERRLTYLSLLHDQYVVDLLSEEDVAAGRLSNYDVLYVTDPCVSGSAAASIADWVRRGGILYGACGAGFHDEYNETTGILSDIFGISLNLDLPLPAIDYGRGRLNETAFIDHVHLADDNGSADFGVLGVRGRIEPLASATVVGRFENGEPAVVDNHFGQGFTRYFATYPGLSYLKDANFVRNLLKEKWPETQRRVINQMARRGSIERPVLLSAPVVDAGLYDASGGLALVLANYTYETIPGLRVQVHGARGVRSVNSVNRGSLPFQVDRDGICRFTVHLGDSDLILMKKDDGRPRGR